MSETIARSNETGKELNYLILMSSKAKLFQRQAGKQYIEPEINF